MNRVTVPWRGGRLAAAGAVLGLLLAGCTGTIPTPSVAESFRALVEDPDSYVALRVRVEASYLMDGEVSVATSRLVGSPPRPTEPTVWVDGPAPDGPCVRRGGGAVWAEDAEISGMFEHAPAGGLGHEGEWTMALEEATVLCPGEEQFDLGG